MTSGRLVAALVVLAVPLHAQGSLGDAARAARAAWLAHDPTALVGSSETIVLQLPGANPSAPLGKDQAVELLRRYLRAAAERSVEIGRVEEVARGNGFVELSRTYTVHGTGDARQETIFLSFREARGRWVLTEVRTGP